MDFGLKKKGEIPGWGYVIALILGLALIIIGAIMIYKTGRGSAELIGKI